ncbi:MAG: isoprenylcysteine carboxylmethyltransferase family protein [Bryobacteraceae bacterium]|jgi:protein-S-isoprenylcysteine O-methyltransferase Ste14
MDDLNARAWFGIASLAVAMALVLFLSAWTMDYWQAWVYLGIFFGASIPITVYLMKNNPALLRRRSRAGPTAEKRKPQKIAMLFASIGFVGALVVPSLDHRFRWSNAPVYAIIAGDVLTVLCFYITFLAYKENSFASATIEIAPDQRVVSTGPYAIVRHPMYAGGLLLFLGTPFALGSCWGLLPFGATLPALIWRLVDEERFLKESLPGYADYCREVRWRMIPQLF